MQQRSTTTFQRDCRYVVSRCSEPLQYVLCHTLPAVCSFRFSPWFSSFMSACIVTMQNQSPHIRARTQSDTVQELFFDLIFVASVIQLAAFLKYNTTWDGVYQAYIVFNILWLTWLHMTFLNNRFKAPLIAKVRTLLSWVASHLHWREVQRVPHTHTHI
jgi:hypothetical protein